MMQNIDALITQRFEENVTYLQYNHRAIYERLFFYEKALDTKERQQRYTLSYEEEQFDIVELQTNRYRYNKQSKNYIDTIVKSINRKRDENVFESFKLLTPTPRLQGYDFAFKLFETFSGAQHPMQKIYKFIFFGCGLHMEAVAKKVGADFYLIVEDDIELFRLSLFTTPYYELAKSAKLFFAIESPSQEFEKISEKFLRTAHYYNHYIKFFESLFHTEEKLQQFHTHIVSQSHLNYFYGSFVAQYTQPLEYLFKSYQFLNLTSKNLQKSLQKRSIILVAPGPSLDANIDFLSKNANNCIIIALSATLPRLEQAGVKPDIITHFDGFERSSIHFERLKDPAFVQNSIALLSAKTPPIVVDFFPKEQVFFFESGTNYKQGFGEMQAFCAGSATYMISVALGFENIYLLGLDLALNQTTLQTHNSNYSYTLEATQDADTLNFRDSIIEIEGNLQQKVKSTPNFALSVKAINEITMGLKQPYQKVFNLNNGAKFFNTITLQPEKLPPCQDQKESQEMLLSLFKESSSERLSQEERLFIEEIYKAIRQREELTQEFAKRAFSDAKAFLAALINFENEICSCDAKSCAVVALLMDNYMQFVTPYIFDAFNNDIQPNFIQVQADLTKNLSTTLEEFSKPFKNFL